MKKCAVLAATAILGVAGLGMMGTAHAVDMGNMMNPSKWFGGDKEKDDYRQDDRDYQGGPPPGYGPPQGQGYPPPQGRGYPGPRGQGYYPPPQGQGYPAPGYGYGGAPAAQARPMPSSPEACAARIRELEARIRQLEGMRNSPPPAGRTAPPVR